MHIPGFPPTPLLWAVGAILLFIAAAVAAAVLVPWTWWLP